MILERTRHLTVYMAIRELLEADKGYPVSSLCRLGGISRSSYYKWADRKDSPNDELNKKIASRIEQMHTARY